MFLYLLAARLSKDNIQFYDIKFHIVWITKYRKREMRSEVARPTQELIRQIYNTNDLEYELP